MLARVKVIFSSTAALSLLFLACSDLVAPQIEGGSNTNAIDQDDGVVRPVGPVVPGGGGGGGGEGGGGGGEGGGSTPVKLGLVEGETSAIADFKAVDTWAEYVDSGMLKSVVIYVANYSPPESQFKQIKEWKCNTCVGDNDSHCKAGETTQKFVTASFSKTFAPQADVTKTDADGYPTADLVEFADFTKASVVGLGFFYTGWTMKMNGTTVANPLTGKVEFLDGKRFSKTAPDYKATINIKEAGSNQYTATVTGKIQSKPTNPNPPADCTLQNKKWAEPVY